MTKTTSTPTDGDVEVDFDDADDSAEGAGQTGASSTRTGCAFTFEQERCDRLVSIVLDAVRV